MKPFYQRPFKETEEEFFKFNMKSVAPGDEIGRKRAAKTATIQARLTQRIGAESQKPY
jgi:hypothetical protein